MIAKDKRIRLAFHLRQLATGRIHNDEFERRIMREVTNGWLPEQYNRAEESKTDDPAIPAITAYAWHLYDDTRQHYLTGKDGLSTDGTKQVARVILFLHSDLPYEWPDISSLNIFTKIINLFKSIYLCRKNLFGIVDYWPFKTESDYQRQLRTPLFLYGSLNKSM